MIITRFKSYPYRDKNRNVGNTRAKKCELRKNGGHTIIGSTDMSHTKLQPNTTKGKRKRSNKQNAFNTQK